MRSRDSKLKVNLGEKAGQGCGLAILGGVLLMFLGLGSVMAVMIARDFLKTAQTYSWQPTECVILVSEVTKGYYFQVEYHYEWEGQSFAAKKYSTKEKQFSDYSDVQRLQLKYPVDTRAICYVNPAAPSEAVLARGSLWFGFVILFPMIFAAIGGGGLFLLIRSAIRQKKKGGKEANPTTESISEKAKSSAGKNVGTLIFGLFLVVGLIVFYFIGIRPVARVISARNWEPVPCTVVSSQVRSHRNDDGTTYSVDILYAYIYQDQNYRANRYNFMGGSSSGRSGKVRIVKQHPPGHETLCYVNPRDPTEAVLIRDFTPSMWLGLIPLLFVAAGMGGLVHLRRRQANRPSWQTRIRQAREGKQSPTTPGAPATQPWMNEDIAPRELKPSVSPLGKFFGGVFVALFWNGIVSVFVWQAAQSWMKGRPEWFLMVFLIPFVLIGLGIIIFVFYALLGLFNARPRLRVTPGAVRLGDSLEVRWELRGRTSMVEKLTITLEGREEAQYRRGTRTYTDKNVFSTLDILDTRDRIGIQTGQAAITIPGGLMHSFEAANNKIIWALKVKGDIAKWPDIAEEFRLTVLPQKPAPTQPSMRLST